MAKKELGFKRSIRNRGESIGYPQAPEQGYQYQAPDMETPFKQQNRAIKRHEVRQIHQDMYVLNQEREQREFARIKAMKNEFYAGVDPRRKEELAEGGIVMEDQNAMANLPRQAIHHEYPRAGYYTSPYIDSLLHGQDARYYDKE